MSIKFPIATLTFATILTIAYGSISSAEVYKTSKDQVIVTGLTAKQKYPIKGVNAKNKPVNRKDIAANTCGEAIIDGGAKYKSLVVGTETIDPATLTTKVRSNCKGKKAASTKKSIVTKVIPAGATSPAATPATVPNVPTMTPAAK
jgi:hypothetical protein